VRKARGVAAWERFGLVVKDGLVEGEERVAFEGRVEGG